MESADSGAVAVPLRSTCPNCGAAAHGHYCANCGQETAVALPTFRAFMREAAGRYVALDGRLWRTLFGLVARPGFLTQEYFAGRRRRYVRPARLFLVLYLLLFAFIGLWQSPADVADQVVFVRENAAAEIEKAEQEEQAEAAKEASALGKAPPEPRKAPVQAGPKGLSIKPSPKAAPAAADIPAPGPIVVAGNGKDTLIGLDEDLNLTFKINGREAELPAFLRKRYEHFRSLPNEEKAERLYSGMLRYGGYAMIILLPVFALLLKLAYLGSGDRYPGRPRRYAEHLVYSAHLHAFAALVVILFMLAPEGPLRAVLALWVVYYVMKARTVVYKGRWWAGVLRALVVATVYLVVVAMAMLGLLAVAALIR